MTHCFDKTVCDMTGKTELRLRLRLRELFTLPVTLVYWIKSIKRVKSFESSQKHTCHLNLAAGKERKYHPNDHNSCNSLSVACRFILWRPCRSTVWTMTTTLANHYLSRADSYYDDLAFMRLCVYEGGLFFATSLRLVPPPCTLPEWSDSESESLMITTSLANHYLSRREMTQSPNNNNNSCQSLSVAARRFYFEMIMKNHTIIGSRFLVV